MESEHRFLSFDATPLFYRRFEPAPPAGPPAQALVLIVHGMGEHGGRYRPIAEYLAALGCRVVVPDLRGFGKSGGRRACVKRFTDFHRDLAALHAHAARQGADLPVFLVGHSFGGLLVSSYLAYQRAAGPVRGLILSSPIFGIGVRVPFWRCWFGLAASYVVPDLTQPTRVEASRLTHDPAILEVYAKDTLIHHRISARLYRELERAIAGRHRIAERIQSPVLVLQAGDDAIVSRPATQVFYDRLGSADKTLRIYEGLYHEIFNETSREEIYFEVGRWILDHIL